MTANEPLTSVILTTPIDPNVLSLVLASSLGQTCASYEMLLVENSSAPEVTREVLRRYETRLPLRYVPREIGDTRARALNRAAQAARGSILIWIPDGSLLDPNVVQAHLAACEKAPCDLVVLGRHSRLLTSVSPESLIDPRVVLRLAAHDPMWERTLSKERTLVMPISVVDVERDLISLIQLLEQPEGNPLIEYAAAHDNVLTGYPLAWMFSSSRSMHRDTYARAGGLDPAFCTSEADLELHYRLTRRGVRTQYEPSAKTYAIELTLERDTTAERAGRARMYEDLRLALTKHQTLEIALAVRLMFGRVGPSEVERLLRAAHETRGGPLVEELTRFSSRAAESELIDLLL